jgi:hypothetical protein
MQLPHRIWNICETMKIEDAQGNAWVMKEEWQAGPAPSVYSLRIASYKYSFETIPPCLFGTHASNDQQLA